MGEASDLSYDEFLICSIANADSSDTEYLARYVAAQAEKGIKVYYPAEHTNQIDATGGYRICQDNLNAISRARVVAVYWTEKSRGSIFDFGAAFHEHTFRGKKIKLINREQVEQIVARQRQAGVKKSLEQVLLHLDSQK